MLIVGAGLSGIGYRQCMPAPDPQGVIRRPLIDLASGYIQRSIDQLPAQGSERPWQVRQNYPLDMLARPSSLRV